MQIGSTTKQMTATALLKKVEEEETLFKPTKEQVRNFVLRSKTTVDEQTRKLIRFVE